LLFKNQTEKNDEGWTGKPKKKKTGKQRRKKKMKKEKKKKVQCGSRNKGTK
jgi:hypothetical protein